MAKVLSGPTIADAASAHVIEIVIRVSQGEQDAPAAGTAWKIGARVNIVDNTTGKVLKSTTVGAAVSALSAGRQTNIADLVAAAVAFATTKIAAATSLDDL